MRPHPRIRKTIKWGGAAVTVLLVVVWAWSSWYTAGVWWTSPRLPRQEYVIGLTSGGMQFVRSNRAASPEWGYSGAHRHRNGINWRALWRDGSPMVVMLPLWIVAAPGLVMTVVAWRLDALARRRVTLNPCAKCGYDRTGLAAGAKCPECGAVPASGCLWILPGGRTIVAGGEAREAWGLDAGGGD